MSASARTAAAGALVALGLAAAPTYAASARVETMVVGRTAVLAPAADVRAAAASVRVRGRTCRVAAGTALAALAARRRAGGPAFVIRDYGSCSSRPADSAALFVTRVGGDANRGQNGWVYKVNGRAGTTAAADPAGPFGTGQRLATGQRVLWFWCVMGPVGCQHTLRVDAPDTVAADGALTVRVRGVDDRGTSTAVAGATVTAGGRTATSGADGAAVLPGSWSGSVTVQATKAGLVPSFPEEVLTG